MVIEFEKLEKLQREWIGFYTKTGAYYLNRKLRENTINAPDFIDYAEFALTIDSIFSLVPTKSNPQILY
ncbi:MAG TPA: hypothetical protein VNY36_00650 [Bacteroidia bacterium]|jgi:hypothetical protein|nr:hypothetical protein [Bacteroidia bacterium]